VLAEQGRVLGEQGRAIAELRAEVADLRRRLGRNSGNSSMPPSADDLPGRVPPKRERRSKGSKRGRGKQPGAPGTSMAWAEPDEVIDHRPAGVCGCGADLAGAADLGVARSCQQLEVPLITARRIQHDLHQARCGCGMAHVAGRPAGVPGSAVSIGPNVRALAVYLVVHQHVPIERCAQLIADVTGARVQDSRHGGAWLRVITAVDLPFSVCRFTLPGRLPAKIDAVSGEENLGG
jgi:transposase